MAKGSRYIGQYKVRDMVMMFIGFILVVCLLVWFKWQFHCVGVHTYEDGGKYFGKFISGVKHRIGQYHFACVCLSDY